MRESSSRHFGGGASSAAEQGTFNYTLIRRGPSSRSGAITGGRPQRPRPRAPNHMLVHSRSTSSACGAFCEGSSDAFVGRRRVQHLHRPRVLPRQRPPRMDPRAHARGRLAVAAPDGLDRESLREVLELQEVTTAPDVVAMEDAVVGKYASTAVSVAECRGFLLAHFASMWPDVRHVTITLAKARAAVGISAYSGARTRRTATARWRCTSGWPRRSAKTSATRRALVSLPSRSCARNAGAAWRSKGSGRACRAEPAHSTRARGRAAAPGGAPVQDDRGGARHQSKHRAGHRIEGASRARWT